MTQGVLGIAGLSSMPDNTLHRPIELPRYDKRDNLLILVLTPLVVPNVSANAVLFVYNLPVAEQEPITDLNIIVTSIVLIAIRRLFTQRSYIGANYQSHNEIDAL